MRVSGRTCVWIGGGPEGEKRYALVGHGCKKLHSAHTTPVTAADVPYTDGGPLYVCVCACAKPDAVHAHV